MSKNKRKRAVSDIIASLILIAIVIAVFGGIVYPLLVRYHSSATSVLSSQQKQMEQAQALISPIYSYTSSSTTYIYFYNFGKLAFTPSEFIINGQTISSFTLIDQQNNSQVSAFPAGAVTELEISGAYNSPFNISVVGNGVTLSWEV